MADDQSNLVLFTERQADRIAAAVLDFEGAPVPLGGGGTGRAQPVPSVAIAQLGDQGTGDYAGTYGWAMIDEKGGTSGLTGTAQTAPVFDPLGLGVGTGSRVAILRAGVTIAGRRQLGFVAVGGGGPSVIPVLLTQTGGGAGNASTTCSFVYSVFAVTDPDKTTPLATGVGPVSGGNRIPNLTYVAANNGNGYWRPGTDGASPTFVLQWLNERPIDPTACT